MSALVTDHGAVKNLLVQVTINRKHVWLINFTLYKMALLEPETVAAEVQKITGIILLLYNYLLQQLICCKFSLRILASIISLQRNIS